MDVSGLTGHRPPDGGTATVAWPPDRPHLGTDCWFLSGPTAAGKSALALRMAGRLDAEILSVDSMAVYRGLDIGTAKPAADERRAVPHHLVDLIDPARSFSVAEWLVAATAAMADCRRRGRRMLFVGGTPLYLRALRDGLAPLPAADAALRTDLDATVAAEGVEALHARLAAVDPVAAARIHQRDRRRIVRGLEVAAITGRPLSAAWRPEPDPLFESRLMIIDLPRRLLHERIDRRVERMFATGLVEETRAALATPGGIGPTARQAAGYAEALELIAGRIDRATAIDRTQRRTRQLAKRQRTWLRSFKNAVWIGG